MVKFHPFHPEKLVEQKRDSNNKPFVPKPKPQKKKETLTLKNRKRRFFIERNKVNATNALIFYAFVVF